MVDQTWIAVSGYLDTEMTEKYEHQIRLCFIIHNIVGQRVPLQSSKEDKRSKVQVLGTILWNPLL